MPKGFGFLFVLFCFLRSFLVHFDVCICMVKNMCSHWKHLEWLELWIQGIQNWRQGIWFGVLWDGKNTVSSTTLKVSSKSITLMFPCPIIPEFLVSPSGVCLPFIYNMVYVSMHIAGLPQIYGLAWTNQSRIGTSVLLRSAYLFIMWHCLSHQYCLFLWWHWTPHQQLCTNIVHKLWSSNRGL